RRAHLRLQADRRAFDSVPLPAGVHEQAVTLSGLADSLHLKLDAQTGLAEHDLIAGLKTYASRPSWHVHGSAVTNDTRPLSTTVVVQPKLPGVRLVRDVCVLARDGLIHLSRSFSECDVVSADEAVATVSHLLASPQVDAVSHERIAPPFGSAARDAE